MAIKDVRQTHTYATLDVSRAAYEEIAAKLKAANYGHAFNDEGTIDMHGLGLSVDNPLHTDNSLPTADDVLSIVFDVDGLGVTLGLSDGTTASFRSSGRSIQFNPSKVDRAALKSARNMMYTGVIPDDIEADDVAQLHNDHPSMQRLIDFTIDHTLDIVAKELKVEHFDAGDGSEDFWGDVGGSVMNLLREAGIGEDATPVVQVKESPAVPHAYQNVAGPDVGCGVCGKHPSDPIHDVALMPDAPKTGGETIAAAYADFDSFDRMMRDPLLVSFPSGWWEDGSLDDRSRLYAVACDWASRARLRSMATPLSGGDPEGFGGDEYAPDSAASDSNTPRSIEVSNGFEKPYETVARAAIKRATSPIDADETSIDP